MMLYAATWVYATGKNWYSLSFAKELNQRSEGHLGTLPTDGTPCCSFFDLRFSVFAIRPSEPAKCANISALPPITRAGFEY